MERRESVERAPFGVGEPAVKEHDRRLDQGDIAGSLEVRAARSELGEGGVELVAVSVPQGGGDHLEDRWKWPDLSDRVGRNTRATRKHSIVGVGVPEMKAPTNIGH